MQQGTFSYTSPEGQLITIHYTADETGFHAQGDHIPTPPPVSEEIQKGLDLIYAGIRQQEVREVSVTSPLPIRSDPCAMSPVDHAPMFDSNASEIRSGAVKFMV